MVEAVDLTFAQGRAEYGVTALADRALRDETTMDDLTQETVCEDRPEMAMRARHPLLDAPDPAAALPTPVPVARTIEITTRSNWCPTGTQAAFTEILGSAGRQSRNSQKMMGGRRIRLAGASFAGAWGEG